MIVLILLSQVQLIIRIAGIVGIFLFNALMWVLFTKSMHLCGSTLEATAFNTASNFVFTVSYGKNCRITRGGGIALKADQTP